MAEGAATPPTAGTPSPASSPGTPTTPAPPAQPTAGEAQTGDESTEEIKDPQALLRTFRQLQEREKTQRTRLQELEAAHKQAEDAKLSEQERLSRRVAELEAAEAGRQRATQERILGYEIKLQAAGLRIIDPDAAVKLLDWSSIEYDADGMPTNLERQLKALVKDKPYLIAPGGPGAASVPGPPPPAASVTNPATRSAAMTGERRYSQADLADRTFYLANRDDIIRAQREGRIDP